MFGLTPAPCGCFSIGDRSVYRSHFCGLCNNMHRRYGVWSRLLINRDSTLLALMGTALSPVEPATVETTCCNLFGRRRALIDDAPQLRFAAAATVCGLGAKLSDDAEDEKGWKSLAARGLSGLLSERVHRATATLAEWDFPVLEVEQHLARQSRAEAEGCGLAAASEATEYAYERIFGHLPQVVECDASAASPLRHLGRSLGSMIYADDAWRDFARDRKQGRYNPLPTVLAARSRVLGEVFQSSLSTVKSALSNLRLHRLGELVPAILLGALSKQAELRYATKLPYGMERDPKKKRLKGCCSSNPSTGRDCCAECCPCDCDCPSDCHCCDCHGCDCHGCDCSGCDCSCH